MTIEETTEDRMKRLNLERATIRRHGQELERILAAWRPLLSLVRVDMDKGPERAYNLLVDASRGLDELPKLREKLAAYERQMLYRIEAFDSDTYYAAPEAIVTCRGETVCGCDSMEQAAKVAAALNRLPEKDN